MEDAFGNSIGGKYGDRFHINNGTGPQRIDDQIGKAVNDGKEYRLPLHGSGPPLITPRFIGDTYFDTDNFIAYSSFGLEVSDWHDMTVGSGYSLLLESGDSLLLE